MGFSTTIQPRPPFFLFVPSLDEIPAQERAKHKGEYFALGHFYKTLKQARVEVKESGYGSKEKIDVLIKQGYFKKVT